MPGHALKRSLVALGEAHRQQSVREVRRRCLRRSQETKDLQHTLEQWRENALQTEREETLPTLSADTLPTDGWPSGPPPPLRPQQEWPEPWHGAPRAAAGTSGHVTNASNGPALRCITRVPPQTPVTSRCPPGRNDPVPSTEPRPEWPREVTRPARPLILPWTPPKERPPSWPVWWGTTRTWGGGCLLAFVCPLPPGRSGPKAPRRGGGGHWRGQAQGGAMGGGALGRVGWGGGAPGGAVGGGGHRLRLPPLALPLTIPSP